MISLDFSERNLKTEDFETSGDQNVYNAQFLTTCCG